MEYLAWILSKMVYMHEQMIEFIFAIAKGDFPSGTNYLEKQYEFTFILSSLSKNHSLYHDIILRQYY